MSFRRRLDRVFRLHAPAGHRLPAAFALGAEIDLLGKRATPLGITRRAERIVFARFHLASDATAARAQAGISMRGPTALHA
jgi:hypothetical protein